jgi:uncharacterized protein (TIGR02996 family)
MTRAGTNVAKAAEQKAWLERAKGADRADLDALVQTLTEGATVKQGCERIAALHVFAPSAAVGDALLAQLDKPAWISFSAEPFWSILFFTLFHHRPSSLERLAAMAQRVEREQLFLPAFDGNLTHFFGDRVPRLLHLLELDDRRASAIAAAEIDVPEPAAVEAATAGGEHERALRQALAAWRWLRTPACAALVETLGARLERRPFVFADGQEAWLAQAALADPADVPRLLAAIGGNTAKSYMVALTEWPHDDARLAIAAADFLTKPKPRWEPGRPLALQLAAMLVLHPCHVALGVLERHVAHDLHLAPLCAAVRARLGRVRAQVDAALGPRRAELEDGFAALARTLGCGDRVTSRSPELLAAIHEDPDSVERKLVYADVLMEEQDPRGELIQLQCARHKLSREQQSRERQLLTDHFAEWVGALAPVIFPPGSPGGGATWFEHGFLHACALQRIGSKLTGARADDPAWRTVRELHLAEGTWGIVTSPDLTQVKWLTGLPLRRAKLLHDAMPALETLELIEVTEAQDDAGVPDWSVVTQRTGLEELRLRYWEVPYYVGPHPPERGPELVEGLTGTPLARDLRTLGLGLGPSPWRHPAALLTFIEETFPDLDVLFYTETNRSSRDPVFRLRRDDAGRLRRATYHIPARCLHRDPFPLLHQMLARLPAASLSDLTIVAPRKPKQASRITTQLARLGPTGFDYAPA